MKVKELEGKGYYWVESTDKEKLEEGISGHIEKMEWKAQEDRIYNRLYMRMLYDKYESIFNKLRR